MWILHPIRLQPDGTSIICFADFFLIGIFGICKVLSNKCSTRAKSYKKERIAFYSVKKYGSLPDLKIFSRPTGVRAVK